MTPQIPLTVACAQCDALAHISKSETGTYRCPRCGAVVLRLLKQRASYALDLYVAAAIFFLMANLLPILTLKVGDDEVTVTLLGAAEALRTQHMTFVAFLVVATTVFFPLGELLLFLASLVVTRGNSSHRQWWWLVRFRIALRPWSMVEILTLGVLVAAVKLGGLAHVAFGLGFVSLFAFTLTSIAGTQMFDPAQAWVQRERST